MAFETTSRCHWLITGAIPLGNFHVAFSEIAFKHLMRFEKSFHRQLSAVTNLCAVMSCIFF